MANVSPFIDKIVFQRPAVIQGHQTQTQQIWVMKADGTGETRLTPVPGTDSTNLFPSWGAIRADCDKNDEGKRSS